MTHARARLAALAILVSVAASAAAPASADAMVSYFSCVNKPPGSWCDGRANGSFDGLHSWEWAWAGDPDWAGLMVCQGLYNATSGAFLTPQTCAPNWTDWFYPNQTCGCLEANVIHWGAGNESINGQADTI